MKKFVLAVLVLSVSISEPSCKRSPPGTDAGVQLQAVDLHMFLPDSAKALPLESGVRSESVIDIALPEVQAVLRVRISHVEYMNSIYLVALETEFPEAIPGFQVGTAVVVGSRMELRDGKSVQVLPLVVTWLPLPLGSRKAGGATYDISAPNRAVLTRSRPTEPWA